MQFGETIAVAFQSIRANKLRTALTMLGVIIGVAAVIAMVALGTGAQRAVEERIAALGANLLTVFPGQSFRQGVASNVRVSLTTDDLAETAAWGPDIEDGTFDGNRFEAIVDLGGGGAEVVSWGYGSTDVWYDGANETYGFPEELLWGCE